MNIPDPRTIQCTVAILAGETSLTIDDSMPKLRRVLDRVLSLGFPVLVATNSPDEHAEFDVPMIDVQPDTGSLGSISAALSSAATDAVLVVTCDRPLPATQLMTHMTHWIPKVPEVDAIVARVGGRPEPMPAVYWKSALPGIEDQLNAGDLRLTNVLRRLRIRWMEEDEVLRYDPHLASFANLNMPDDPNAHEYQTFHDSEQRTNPPSHL